MNWVTRLYPKAWRARYGREFDALLEDARPSWRGLADVLWGAMKTRFETIDWRIAAAFALAGLAAAAVVTIRTPDRYTSAAVLQLRAGPETDAEALTAEAWRLRSEAMSRHSLAGIIQEPQLNLYQSERETMPIEDVIRDLKERDLKVEILPGAQGNKATVVRVSYAGPDAFRAQGMVQALTIRLIDDHLKSHLRTSRLLGRGSLSNSEASAIEVMEPARLPDTPVRPNWWAMEGAGLTLGLLACFAVFGLAAAVRRFPRAVLSGVVTAVLAGLASLAIPWTYESAALMQLDSAQTRNAILHDHALMSSLLQAGTHLEPGPVPRELVVRARGSDRFEAQKTAQALLTRLIDALFSQQKSRQNPHAPAGAPWLEVVDPASLPTAPISYFLPFSWWMISGGLLFGTTTALLLKFDSRRQPPFTEQIPVPDV